jgi:V/A-type H+-transporting ATPase subunit K
MNMRKISLLLSASLVVALLTTLLYVLSSWHPVAAAADATAGIASLPPQVLGWGYVAAALATGLSAIAAGVAVASVGAAAMGAVAEKPELFGRALVMVGLAEGIAIYGLIVSIVILNKLA